MFGNSSKSIILSLSAGFMLVAISCNPAKKYEKQETDAITSFITSNDGFDKKPSGLYYKDETIGTGRQPVKADTAYVWYTGKFLNGTTFDTNIGNGGVLMYFPVDEDWMIAGFDEGITYMKEGGKAQFLVPSNLGYGPNGYYTIPGYTPLLYEVQLVKVAPGPSK